MAKECGTCTKCCEGWLTANINGRPIYPGKPCIFVEINKGCKIYGKRPVEPCKNFLCAWMQIEDMPDEFKPENSGVIMNYNYNNGNGYWSISKAPNNVTPQFLSWAINYAMYRKENIIWFIDDKSWWLGNDEFNKQMSKEYLVDR